MSCMYMYKKASQRSRSDILNEKRDKSLEKLEAELGQGIARIEKNPFTGAVEIIGASEAARPEGMSDLCVLATLQDRNSIAWQTASTVAGVNNQNFVHAHNHAHAHGHSH